jgi:hypothetical protein
VDAEHQRRYWMQPFGWWRACDSEGAVVYQMTHHPAPVTVRPAPQPGDVLASRCSARSDVYTISVIAGPTQVVAGVYDQALETVRRFAQLHAVDGWYTCDHTHFLCVAHHRSKGDRMT